MRKQTIRDGRSAIRCAVAEALESRRLFAAIESGILVARGTAGNDTLSLRRTGSDDVIVTTNGTNQTFDMDDFTGGVSLAGLGGDDVFHMVDALISPVVRNTTIHGGDGNDTVDYSTRTAMAFRVDPTGGDADFVPGMVSGAQADQFGGDVEMVIGGSGNDTFFYAQRGEFDEGSPTTSFRLEGRGGNDSFRDLLFPDEDAYATVSMFGGDGNDAFGDESDNNFTADFFFGEAGNDEAHVYDDGPHNGLVDGGSGVDTMIFSSTPGVSNSFDLGPNFENGLADGGTLFGNDGPNHLTIGEGTIFGGGGNDTLVGGDEADSLDGGAGNDTLIGNAGNDTLNGGAGDDFADGDGGQNTHIAVERFAGTGAAASIAIVNGVLVAGGTNNAETITIRRSLSDDVIINVGSLSRSFDMDDFTAVHLLGFGGADTIRVIDPIVAGALVRPVTLDGGAGDDTLVTSTGNETILGGGGVDTVDYSARTARLVFNFEPDDGLGGEPTRYDMVSGAETDVFGTDVERYVGGSGNDGFGLIGRFNEPSENLAVGPLILEGRGGNDGFSHIDFTGPFIIRGGDGNDAIGLDEGGIAQSIEGGNGDDRITYEDRGPGHFLGGAGVDTIRFDFHSGPETFDLREYPDVENVDLLNDFETNLVIGNDLPNRINTGPNALHDMTLRGLGGNDTLIGGDQDDLLEGGEGNDSLVGAEGNDTLDGGAGADFGDGGPGANTHVSIEQFPAGTGTASIAIVNRVLTASGSNQGEQITIERVLTDDVIVRIGALNRTLDMDDFDTVLLNGNGGDDLITIIDPVTAGALTRKVTLDGGAGNDSLTGNSGEDVLRGGDDADTLRGEGGADALFGNAGDDLLNGGLGLDFLDGGDNDDFISAEDGAGGDTVLGGSGTNDRALVDAGDDASGVETIIPAA